MPLYLIVFLLVNITLNYQACAATNVCCPETLTTEQLIQLDQKGQMIHDNKIYTLNGSSRQALDKSNRTVLERSIYQRISSNGKSECWYKTIDGFNIGIIEK